MEFIVEETEKGQRIDNYLIDKLDMSRSKIQSLVEEENVLVNNHVTKNSYKVKENDVVFVEEEIEIEINIVPEKMDLDIVYEDDDLLVVNKANGIVVHPAVGHNSNTLVNGLMYHSVNLSSNNGMFRPGIVHRIDSYTTGLLVVAKNDKAHEFLAKQLEEKTTTRKYVALVWGVINNDTGTIDAPIGRDLKDRKKMTVLATGKNAITHFKVLERYKTSTLVELQLETGRTHQIRVHMNYIGFPIVNDSVYGKKNVIDKTGQCLHAKVIGFIHPTTKEYMEFLKEEPSEFNIIKDYLKNL
jgi:23S rRNA pseudouridine1911/1915/1917 synthase